MWQENYSVQGSARDFMHKVYGWMSVALVVTTGVSYYIASTPAIYMTLFKSPMLLIGICALQFGTVMFLSWKIHDLSYSSAVAVFMMYAALTGVTVSSILIVYTFSSVFLAFGITAGMFSSMAIYGYITDTDLTSMGNVLLMGLWGMIIAMFANMWFQSPAMQYWISIAAVGIFTLLTAYDSQKIKRMGQSLMVDPETKNKIAIMGALTLYLDFINLFLHLVRLFGKKK
ncbi:MAG: FtsH-binding integral membrane protein [Alteromonas naphthalenivorans]|jgi:FtsH-binding integral membrane protein